MEFLFLYLRNYHRLPKNNTFLCKLDEVKREYKENLFSALSIVSTLACIHTSLRMNDLFMKIDHTMKPNL